MERISYIDEGDMDHEGSWNAITVVLMDVYWCTEWHAVCRGLQRQILAGFRDLLIKTLCFTRCSSKKNITTVIKVISVFIVSRDFKNIGPLSCACSCLLLYPASVYWDDDGQHCEPSALSRKMREGEFLCVCWQLVPLCLSHFSPSLSVCSPSACSCVCVRVCL